MLEFDADRIRQRKSILQRAGVDASMGCAWLRCPLHGNEMAEPRRDMMFCVGCRKVWHSRSLRRNPQFSDVRSVQVQYCDARCQRLYVPPRLLPAFVPLIPPVLQGLGGRESPGILQSERSKSVWAG